MSIGEIFAGNGMPARCVLGRWLDLMHRGEPCNGGMILWIGGCGLVARRQGSKLACGWLSAALVRRGGLAHFSRRWQGCAHLLHVQGCSTTPCVSDPVTHCLASYVSALLCRDMQC